LKCILLFAVKGRVVGNMLKVVRCMKNTFVCIYYVVCILYMSRCVFIHKLCIIMLIFCKYVFIDMSKFTFIHIHTYIYIYTYTHTHTYPPIPCFLQQLENWDLTDKRSQRGHQV
jgi:hypothetical protein